MSEIFNDSPRFGRLLDLIYPNDRDSAGEYVEWPPERITYGVFHDDPELQNGLLGAEVGLS
jgi:hypothetical protein